MMEKNKARTLRKIGQICHMMNDIQLFLDTHPESREAMAAYAKYQKSYNMYKDEYEKTYGPLTPGINPRVGEHEYEKTGAMQWKWVQGPWPWEREANGYSGKEESGDRK